MQRTDSWRSKALTPVGWRFVWLGLGLLLAAWPAMVLGDELAPVADGEISDLEPDSFWFSDRFTGRNSQVIGGRVRGGFVTGPGIGREDSFFPLEFMPYSLFGNGMLFGDLRGFRTTQDHWGTNVGLGYRHYVPAWDRIFGINAYYDYDNSSTKLFRQWGMGLETYGAGWDSRLNTYFPTSEESKLLQIDFVEGSQRFAGNQILFDQVRTLGTPMRGFDHELGVPLPGRVLERLDARAYAGWYHFQAQEVVDHVWGWKGRLQANPLPNVNVGLEVTNDRVFDTNVIFSVAVSYGGYHEPADKPRTQFNRMTTPVQRQYNIVVARTPVLEEGLVALKPDGTPYFVEHVANNPNDPNLPPFIGTVEDPFLTIAQAQANPGGDIIFVHTNSVYDGVNIVLNEENVRVLGEGDGVVHRFLLEPFGLVDLPRVTNNPDPNVVEARPLFLNAVGDGVSVAVSNTEFSGFQLGSATDATTGPTNNGIFATNVTNVDINFVDVNFAGADGVLLDSVGEFRFFQTRIFNAADNGLHVVGGRPRVRFEGDGEFNAADPLSADIIFNATNVGNSAVLIEDTLAGSFVDLFGANPSAIHYTGAGGILVQNSAGSAQFGDVFIASNQSPVTGEAINIINDSGAYTFSRPVEVNDSLGDSINIENLAVTGVASFQFPVTIVDRGARGIDLLNNAGAVRFNDAVSITTAALADFSGDPAIEYQLSTGNVTFASTTATSAAITISGGLGEGILIGDPDPNINNSGVFLVRQSTNISDIGGININVQDDDSAVTFNGVDIEFRGSTGINLVDNRGPITFNVATTVANGGFPPPAIARVPSNQTAVIIRNNSEPVDFTDLTVIDAYNDFIDSVAGVEVTDNPSTVTFDVLNISTLAAVGGVNNAGVALFARRVGDTTVTPVTGGLFVGDGIIDAINESAIDVQASVIGMAFESVSAQDSIGPGIILANNRPLTVSTQIPAFLVTGNASGALFTGGTITNSQLDTFNLESQTAPLLTLITSGSGVLLRNTGVVALNDMLIELSDESGIDVQTDALFVDFSSIQGNFLFGIDALNTPTLEVTDSTFTLNGVVLLLANDIRAQANVVDTYDWLFDFNDITQSFEDAVLLQSLPGAGGSVLNLVFTNNNVTTLGTTILADSSNLDIDWEGPLNALIDNNAFTFLAALDNGIEIITRDDLDLALVTITNNSFQGIGVGNRGIVVTALGPSSYLIDNNIMQLTNPANAMSFFLDDGSNTVISDNLINIVGEGSDGIVFQSISAPADVRIEGNDITITDINGTLVNEIGIDFQATNGVIDFFGDFDNIITINTGFGNPTNGTGFPWFNFPINGQFTGSILVNGSPNP